MYRQVKVALVSTIAPLHAVQADEPDISTVVLTSPEDSLRQSMVITFDEPTALTEVELDLAPVVGDSPGEIVGDTLIIETEPSEVIARPVKDHAQRVRPGDFGRRDSYGSNNIYCGINYGFSDFNGMYGVQRACGVRSAPWYFKLASYWVASAASGVSERGMKWWRNGYQQPMNARTLTTPLRTPSTEPILQWAMATSSIGKTS